MSVFEEAPRLPDESEAEHIKIAEDQIEYGGQQAEVIEIDQHRRHDHAAEARLAVKASQGDSGAFDELLRLYKPLIRLMARNYFIAGGEDKDVVQEAMLGLYKAVKDYDSSMSSFNAFARLCITRQIITAVKTATRKKHAPLNTYVSFSHSVGPEGDDSDGAELGNALAAPGLNLDEAIVGQEGFQLVVDVLKNELSPLEYNVLKLFIEGSSYKEMAEQLLISEKTIDNALQRVKRKVAAGQERSERPASAHEHFATTTPINWEQPMTERRAFVLASLRGYAVDTRSPEAEPEKLVIPANESLADVNQEFYITYSALENMRRHGINIAEPDLTEAQNEVGSDDLTKEALEELWEVVGPTIVVGDLNDAEGSSNYGARKPGKFIIANTAPKGSGLLLKYVTETQKSSDPDGVTGLERDYPIPPLSDSMARSMFTETLEWGPEPPIGAYILPQSDEALEAIGEEF